MSSGPSVVPVSQAVEGLVDEIARLAGTASVEVNVQDEKLLTGTRQWFPEGMTMYVSHLPGQTWDATSAMCQAVRRAGYEPVPHVPVRLITSAESLERILHMLAVTSRPRGILLISGDYPEAKGPYSEVAEVLESPALTAHGFTEVAVAGHPEGHAQVPNDRLHASERRKLAIAQADGLQATIVTQFLFEPEPFIVWANELRMRGVTARVACGLAGPAKITTLFRYATRCGVGASIRALGARPSSVKGLLGDHGPDRMLRGLAEARVTKRCEFTNVHMFCFGGLIRTAEWLARVADRDFVLRDSGGFTT